MMGHLRNARNASGGDQSSDPGAVGACLGVGVLERIVRAGPAASSSDAAVVAHLQACSACRTRLDEMHEADAFIIEFGPKLRQLCQGMMEQSQVGANDGSGGPGEPVGLPWPARHADPSANATPPMPDDLPGYAVEALIAFGGQGAVHRARQLATGRTVAIKMPLEDALRHPAKRYRFRREIELTARLDHPGIVGVLGACETPDGRIGCVMEFVEGIAFDVWAAQQRGDGRSGLERIVATIMKVADAIAYAHQHAVMHRDIKPSNVVVAPDGSPRVLDFGLAKAIDDSAGASITVTGAFLGTLAYAAPEQLTPAPGGRAGHTGIAGHAGHRRLAKPDATDVRTDIHGIGLLLYQAITGRLPYATETSVSELIRCICEAPSPAPSAVVRSPAADGGGATIDPDLDAIVLMAIAKEKDRRYQSATELRDDLARWVSREPVRARFDSRWYVVRRTAWRHRRALAAAAVVMTLLGTIGVLGAIALRSAVEARISATASDTRTLESHWVAIAESRGVARDNFMVGERLAWDALLRPESALVREGVEGMEALGAVPTSPAYWALWEMYARTPIVASLPAAVRQKAIFDASGDCVLTVVGRALQWWNWRERSLERVLLLPVDESFELVILWASPGMVLLKGVDGPLLLVDTDRMTTTALGTETATCTCACATRVAVCVPMPGGATRLEVWDIVGANPMLVATSMLPEQIAGLAIDVTGEALAAATHAGELITVDVRTGDAEFHRCPPGGPRFIRIGSRGRPGELIAWGTDRYRVLNLVGTPPRALLGEAQPATGVIDILRAFGPSPRSGRYTFGGDRNQVGIGEVDRPVTEGRFIPTIRALAPVLSPDGRRVSMWMRELSRSAVLDLESGAIRRLAHPAGPAPNGRATIFDLAFTPDGGALLSAAMDGSVRRFAVPDGSPELVVACATPVGVARLAIAGDELFLGSHELGRTGAGVLRVRATSVERLEMAPQRWFCGLAVEPGVALWALTGDGHLFRIDPKSGATERDANLGTHRATPGHRALARMPQLGLILAGPGGPGLHVLDERSLEPACEGVATSPMHAIEVSPVAGDRFATTHDDGKIRLWRVVIDGGADDGRDMHDTQVVARVELEREMGSHAGAVFCAAFHPAGRLLATGGGAPEAKDVRIWDTLTGRELAALELFDLGVFALAFSPDGRWLAAGGEVDAAHADAGGQLFLIDLEAPNRCIVGNLEHHIERLREEDGRLPESTESMRAWAARLRVGEE